MHLIHNYKCQNSTQSSITVNIISWSKRVIIGTLRTKICVLLHNKYAAERRIQQMQKHIRVGFLPLIESQQFVRGWIHTVHVPMRCQSKRTRRQQQPGVSGSSSFGLFPLVRSAGTSLRRKLRQQLIGWDSSWLRCVCVWAQLVTAWWWSGTALP